MQRLSVDDIIRTHAVVEKRFSITPGILNKGHLDAIAHRPETEIRGKTIYDTVYLRGACLVEGLIRWHPFADGNKRTALLLGAYYLSLHGYAVIFPPSAVRLTVQIAKNKKTDSKSTKKLIKHIAKWLKHHSWNNLRDLRRNYSRYVRPQYALVRFYLRIGLRRLAIRTIEKWLAIDIYPEYRSDVENIVEFLQAIRDESADLFMENHTVSVSDFLPENKDAATDSTSNP